MFPTPIPKVPSTPKLISCLKNRYPHHAIIHAKAPALLTKSLKNTVVSREIGAFAPCHRVFLTFYALSSAWSYFVAPS